MQVSRPSSHVPSGGGGEGGGKGEVKEKEEGGEKEERRERRGRRKREEGEGRVCLLQASWLMNFQWFSCLHSHLTAVLRPLMCSMSGFVWALRAQTQVHACAATDISPGSVF